MTSLINILIYKQMKKNFFLMLTLLMLGTASMNAQVRIGGLDDPYSSAVLDLNANNDAAPAGNKGGLSLPRISLASETAQLNGAVPLNGTVVYNTGGNLSEGIHYWTGGQWVYISGFVPKIITQPARFTFGRLRDAEGDPNAPAFTTKTLKVEASGPGLTYQWYQKAKNVNAPDIELTGATTPAYTFPAPAEGVANWGLYQFYCVVSNVYGNVKSDLAEIAVGCGAKTATGGWLKFMCYNLGATDRTADPFSWTTPADSAILGKFYQWGRPNANHRAVNDTTNFTTSWAYPYDWKIPAGYNNPITNSYRQDDFLWRNHKTNADPCPDGWHIPSQSAFAAIFKGIADADVPANATANTWDPSDRTWSWNSATDYGNGGYAVQPDGSTTTLFFPATGYRHTVTGALHDVGFSGAYWSGTSGATGAFELSIDSERVYLAYVRHRGNGLSIRCVSE
jgi:uncharacterized protein (TIGR02145 family)